MRYTLGKEERLKSKKQITLLFTKGKRIKKLPLVLIYIPLNLSNNKVRVAFSVPKKNIKLAVDRNRIKRIMREAYRKNKALFNNNYTLMFLYVGNKEISYNIVEKALKKTANTLKETCENEK